jgi:hypothetical protein
MANIWWCQYFLGCVRVLHIEYTGRRVIFLCYYTRISCQICIYSDLLYIHLNLVLCILCSVYSEPSIMLCIFRLKYCALYIQGFEPCLIIQDFNTVLCILGVLNIVLCIYRDSYIMPCISKWSEHYDCIYSEINYCAMYIQGFKPKVFTDFNIVLSIFRDSNNMLCIYRDLNIMLCIFRHSNVVFCIFRELNSV